MIVAFAGSGGTGKTTLCETLAHRLSCKGLKVAVRTEFEYFLLKYLSRLFGRFSKRTGTTDCRRYVLHGSKSNIFRLWLLPAWLDELILHLYLKWLKKDSVVLTDRYAYDVYVSLMLMGVDEHFFRKLFLMFPKPDILVFLDVSAKTAVSRKAYPRFAFDPAFNLEFYENMINCYRQFAKLLGVKMVNSEQPLESILDILERNVLQKISDK